VHIVCYSVFICMLIVVFYNDGDTVNCNGGSFMLS